jgi:trehalose/maltose transport system permease protein
MLAFVYFMFPFLWAVSSSLKQPQELFATPAVYIPSNPAWDNYRQVFTRQPFARNLLNSALVAGGTTFLCLAAGGLAAYAMARRRFPGRRFLFYLILAVSMFPQISLLGGMYRLVNAAGLYNALTGLMLSYLIFTLPFTVYVMTGYLRQVPLGLEEAAAIDGANLRQTLWHVLMPIMAPGMVTAGLLTFIQAWNEFLFALTFTADSRSRTVPVAIALYSGASQHELPWAQIMAASVVVTLPLVLLVLFFQRRIVAGLTAGAIKD